MVLFAMQLTLTAELERRFWDCDYKAASTLLSSADAAQCSQVYEKFYAERFKSFEEFLVYWRANKEREHKARAARHK